MLLDETRMLVTSDGIVTAGAAMGHLDLALWFIRQASPELAAVVSRYLQAYGMLSAQTLASHGPVKDAGAMGTYLTGIALAVTAVATV